MTNAQAALIAAAVRSQAMPMQGTRDLFTTYLRWLDEADTERREQAAARREAAGAPT